MGKVHFISLVCPDFDCDIMKQWCAHYRDFCFDKYVVWIHSPGDNKEKVRKTIHTLLEYGFEIAGMYGSNTDFKSSGLKVELLDPYYRSLDKDDKAVVADSDDFHIVPVNDYKKLILEYDCLQGLMIDRWDKTLHDAVPGKPLSVQFPHKGWFTDVLMDTYPELSLQVSPARRKYISFKAGYDMNFTGCHIRHNENETGNDSIYPEMFDIHHYTFRSTVLERIACKYHFNLNYMYCTMAYFGLSKKDITPAVQEAIDKQRDLQLSKGWLPSPDKTGACFIPQETGV